MSLAVPAISTLMPPNRRKNEGGSVVSQTCSEKPDLEGAFSNCPRFSESKDVKTREMLRCLELLPSATRKALLGDEVLRLPTRFRLGLQQTETLVYDFLDDGFSQEKRDYFEVLKQWLATCRFLPELFISLSSARREDRVPARHQEDAWILLGDIILSLPDALLNHVVLLLTEMHDPFLIRWQHISYIVTTADCIFDAFVSVPILASAPNPIAKTDYYRKLSKFFDYVIGWQVLPSDTPVTSRSVKAVYGDRSQLDTFFTSLGRSAQLVMFILCDVLYNAICALNYRSPLDYTILSSMDELFLFASDPANERDRNSLINCLDRYEDNLPSLGHLSLRVKWLTSTPSYQLAGVDKRCSQSFLNCPAGALSAKPSADVPACSCTKEKPSKRCLHYCWWFWNTVLSNLLPVLSDLIKVRGFVHSLIKTELPVSNDCMYIAQVVKSVTKLSRFECNRFLLSSARAIQRLSDYCNSTRIHLSVDQTVEELVCKSILSLSNFPIPVAKAGVEEGVKLLREVKIDEDVSAIKKLQKLAQYEKAVVDDYLKRKDWI